MAKKTTVTRRRSQLRADMDEAAMNAMVQTGEREEHERAYTAKMERDAALEPKPLPAPLQPKAPEEVEVVSCALLSPDGATLYEFRVKGIDALIIQTLPRTRLCFRASVEEARTLYRRLVRKGYEKW